MSPQGVSGRVKGAELVVACVDLDGLGAMYGGEARLVNSVPQYLTPRAGVGNAKFPQLFTGKSPSDGNFLDPT